MRNEKCKRRKEVVRANHASKVQVTCIYPEKEASDFQKLCHDNGNKPASFWMGKLLDPMNSLQETLRQRSDGHQKKAPVPMHSIRPVSFRCCRSGDTQSPDVLGEDSPCPCGLLALARV